ncbi:MAG: hypothetical protein BGO12_16360 [Verrucomicrobia bacterium 61-8]|nr:hypothetical protein [Verrucomicrobiota bacterium]OJV16128.1 MAG: hypothetical protein BGO12_16360 [Verrucomicrobia bacterium 61-8]
MIFRASGIIGFVVFCLACAGCVTVPIEAKTSKGQKFYGSAKAHIFAVNGTFEMVSVDGLKAWGKYPVAKSEVVIPFTFTMSDGRTGKGIFLRQGSLNNGKGSGEISDGTKMEFQFGSVIDGTPSPVIVNEYRIY